ncbi:MAG: glyoxylase-like metal-dependent hydrolase (beta-lactamase superfamily II) [Myxococcota bacterium]|jgi:glyoxylase-like metal-dependent hydrolase (beta-lactamase superfamily II)
MDGPKALRCYGPGLFGWGRYQERWRFDFNGHALVNADGTVLVVDPIEPTSEELSEIKGLGETFVVVLLNADHERAARAVAQQLGASIWAPLADIDRLKDQSVETYESGHEFPGGWVAQTMCDLKTPGETVLHHAERRVLVVGDALVGDPVNGMRLVPPVKIPDHDRAMRSVAGLLDFDFDALLLSDGYCLPQGGKAVVRAFVSR